MESQNTICAKKRDIVRSIYNCVEQTTKVELISDRFSCDATNAAVQKLLDERKKVANAFIDSNGDSEKQSELVLLFSKYNNEIINILGLATI